YISVLCQQPAGLLPNTYHRSYHYATANPLAHFCSRRHTVSPRGGRIYQQCPDLPRQHERLPEPATCATARTELSGPVISVFAHYRHQHFLANCGRAKYVQARRGLARRTATGATQGQAWPTAVRARGTAQGAFQQPA
ncbi:hypothetical protein BGZ74_006701, partial [Mortierella antarctica]